MAYYTVNCTAEEPNAFEANTDCFDFKLFINTYKYFSFDYKFKFVHYANTNSLTFTLVLESAFAG